MPGGAQAGTAYVRIVGDLGTLNKQLVATFSPAKMKKLGAAAGVGVAAGFAAKGLFDLGQNFDKQFDRIRTQTGATGKTLKGLEGDFKSVLKTVPASFDDVGTAVAGLNQRLGITGKPLRDLTKQIVQLSKITGTDVQENVESISRLFGDWSISSSKQAKTLDELFRVTQKTGIPLSDLSRLMVQFGSPLRQLGIGFDEAATMFGKFEKEGVNIQTIMPGFRFALKNLSKPTGEAAAALEDLGIKTRDPKKALQEVFAAIKNAPTDLKANAIAFDIFGRRAGPDMAAAIREGRFELDDLQKQMRDGKDTIDEAEKSTRDFGEQWQILKNRVFVAIEPVASKFFSSIGDGMREINELTAGGPEGEFQRERLLKRLGLDQIDLGPVKESISSSLDSIKSIIDSKLAALVSGTVLGSLKKQIAAIGQVFRGAADVIAGALKLIDDLIHLRFAKAFGDLAQIVKGGVNAAIGALRIFTAPVREIMARVGRALLVPLQSAWQSIKRVFSGGISAALGALRGMASAVASIGGRIAGALRRVDDPLRGVGNAFRLVRRVAEDSFAGIRSAIQFVINKVNDLFSVLKKAKDAPGKAFDFLVPGRAQGGRIRRDEALTLVGEQGPEIVSLPVGSYVHKNSDSKRIAKGMGIPGFARGGTVTASGNAGLVPAMRWLVDEMKKRFGLSVSSGVRPGDVGSFHSVGKAADFVGAKMREGAEWVKTSGLYKTLLEGIHNPNLSTDSGKLVSPGFWGAGTWADHKDHVHLAAQTIAAAVKTKLDQKGGTTKKPTTLRGRTLSTGQMVTLAKRVGFPDPALAAAVGYAESRGKVGAVGDSGDSLGLWQINTPAHPNYDAKKLQTDAFYNARAALAISKHGKSWQPWTQFRTGAYKQFLGAKGKPLPSGETKGSGTPTGSAYTDFLAMKLTEAENTSSNKDNLKWINRAMRYWRGVYRRNRSSNFARANEALGELNTLKEKKKEIKKGGEDPDVYKLGDLAKIGKGPNAYNLAFMQDALDQIELEKANASLTLPPDDDDSAGALSRSLQDDIAAASKAVNLWTGIKKLTDGYWITPPTPPPADAAGRIALIDATIAREKKKHTPASRKRIRELERERDRLTKPQGGNYVIGTRGQQTEAATNLSSALSELKGFNDEIGQKTTDEARQAITDRLRALASLAALTPGKDDDIAAIKEAIRQYEIDLSTAKASGDQGAIADAADALKGARDDLKNLTNEIATEKIDFATAFVDVFKQYGSNFRPQSFEGGGIVPGPSGKPKMIEAHGQEWIFDPRTGNINVIVKSEDLKGGARVVNIDARHEFKTVPKEPHTWSRNVARELEAAI